MPWIVTGYDENGEQEGYWDEDYYTPPPDPYTGDWRDNPAYTSSADDAAVTADLTKGQFWDEIKTLPAATQASLAQLTTDGINKLVGLFKKQATNPNGTPKTNADGTPDMSDIDWAKITGLGGAAIGLFADKTPITAGSTLPIPNYDVARSSVQYNDTNRLPGEVGRDYFSETRYTPRTGIAATDATARAADLAAVKTEATGIASGYKPTGPEVNPYASGDKAFKTRYNPAATATPTDENGASGVASLLPISARMPRPKAVQEPLLDEVPGPDLPTLGPEAGQPPPQVQPASQPFRDPQLARRYFDQAPMFHYVPGTSLAEQQKNEERDYQNWLSQQPINDSPIKTSPYDPIAGAGTDPPYYPAGFTADGAVTGGSLGMAKQPPPTLPAPTGGLAGLAGNNTSMPMVPDLPNAPPVKTAAEGGLMSFAKGGANYLRGRTDGMADKLNTSIDNRQAAKLSHGEFVIPADVVSHLGNGNSDAGADKLYQMMAKIRKARTGNPKQGKRINPDKFMPGGLATMNMGGAIGFPDGGAVTGTAATTSTAPKLGTSTSSSLSPWAAPYVTSLLGKTAAEANSPYTAYKGPLVAGTSDLQNKAFAGAKTVADAGYDPTKFTGGTFDAAQAQKYMNPYLSAVLDPQMAELKRQADITRVGDAGRMTQAGAFGGSRQAIAESEGRKNLLNTQAATLGTGYASAYDKAMGQFNTQADRDMGAQKASEDSRQFSANFGLKSLADLERMGATQRQIAGEGIAADKAQFEEQRNYPREQLKFQRDMITGLPISTAATTSNTSQSTNASNDLRTLTELLKTLGIVPK